MSQTVEPVKTPTRPEKTPRRTIAAIERQLKGAMRNDRRIMGYEIRRIQNQLKKRGKTNQPSPNAQIDRRLDHLFKRARRSASQRASRADRRRALCEAHIHFPEELPITAKKDDIVAAIDQNQVVIISGETGSGKTTQIPKCCLAAGRGVDGLIGCTQPRRIAAITVANRIADELGESTGASVGYKIRFQDRTPADAFIKIMTDGILLAEAQQDRYLNAYDVIIVDEAHERSLNIDFILGMLKTLLVRRKDLKLVITSATIDTQKFSRAFDDAPVIEVSGRLYPVALRYWPPGETTDGEDADGYVDMAVRAVEKLQAESRFGDILVFMPTEQDIRETCQLLESRWDNPANILPLFARLTAPEQARVFKAVKGRKIIIATNIAETSITIPGIKYVIDTGLARISQYSPRTRITSLPITRISQSSADQRKGRCGRVADGICIRLYDEEDYLGRPVYTPPEILRANLAEVSLHMIALRLGELSRFPFVDPPDFKSIRDGYQLLLELGAIVERDRSALPQRGEPTRYELTPDGRLMARIPIDPRLSRILIQALREGCVKEMTIIAAALSIADPRERPSEKTQAADQAHEQFEDPLSDFITLLNIWNRYHAQLDKGTSNNQMRRFCHANFLSYKRMREWRDVYRQITLTLQDHADDAPTAQNGNASGKKKQNKKNDAFGERYTAIHKALLSGFLSNIAVKKEKNMFQAAQGREVMLFPGSGLFNASPQWIMAAEMVATSRLFARCAAAIDHRWLESLAGEQCKYSHADPHWERNREEVVVYEQVSLYGLIIVPRRKVAYGSIDPQKATEVFINAALVEGDVKNPLPFMEHNQAKVALVRDMENRLRRRDLLVDEYTRARFFEKRLGTVYSMRTLKGAIREKGDDRFLRMELSDLMNYAPDTETLQAFPDRIDLGDERFECLYQFDPGRPYDGVTVKIPAAAAAAVPTEALDWMVPGLQKEKITALIKRLPKKYRKKLVPAAETAEAILREIESDKRVADREAPLASVLSRFAQRRLGVAIPEMAWMQADLPDHLKMRVTITDAQNKELHSGRDHAILKKDYAQEIAPDETGLFESAKKRLEKTGLTRWDCGDIQEAVIVKGPHGMRWSGYYALEPDQHCVHLRVFQHKTKARQVHPQGVQKLYMLHFAKELKFLKRRLALPKSAKPLADYFGGAAQFETQLYQGLMEQLFAHDIRTQQAFDEYAQRIAPSLHTRGHDLLAQSIRVLEQYHAARTTLYGLENEHRREPLNRGGADASTPSTLTQLVQQLCTDLDKLVPSNFTRLYNADRLDHIVRYIKAMEIRAQRAAVDFAKDRQKAEPLETHITALKALLRELMDAGAAVSEDKKQAIEEYHWCIEEYKVSLFAQELKTAFPVSAKRLKKMLKNIQQMI